MKARIFLDGNEIFTSNKISKKNLDKKETEIKHNNNCLKMEQIIKRGYKLFTS